MVYNFFSFTYRHLPWLCLLLSAAPLSFALISQYGFGLFPCELCIWQRYPYVGLIVLAVAMRLFLRYHFVVRALLWLSCLLWLTEAGLAFYHVGVEQSWWSSATGCSVNAGATTSIEELRASIMAAPLVSCNEATALLLGLSMAVWNFIFALLISVYMILISCMYRSENRHESKSITG